VSLTADDFRRLALELPETSESSHMDHPDFRVRGKIFATLWPDGDWGMVKLKPEQQQLFTNIQPSAFVPVKGGWGRQGGTSVLLKVAGKAHVREALLTAWRNVAPKGLADQFKMK
jgi:hypothetical protein